ncbi:MAG: hypothetical protein Q4Q19_03540 [Methanobrevibacter sp.]|jgi:ABC-type xylose transport system substrate-binding protein|nr:hypothetical protein [Methanobrevibacter sp.]
MYNIEKSPQYDLYRLTKKLNLNKEKLVPKNADSRCVKSTIINRAYYSSYSLASEWLNYNFDFQIKSPKDYYGKKFYSGHVQVLKALFKYGKIKSHTDLGRLKRLRTKSDYYLESQISDNEVKISLVFMENIFNDLKFGD